MTKQGHQKQPAPHPGAAMQRVETIEAYLARHVGETWLPENSDHVLAHIRQVEATWAAIAKSGVPW